MVVDDFVDGDAVHGAPIEAAVVLERRRVLGRVEQESVRVVQVDSEVPSKVTCELVAPAGEVAHVVERLGGCKVLQAECDLGRAGVAPPPLKAAVVGEEALELLSWEQDFHGVDSGTRGDRTVRAYDELALVVWMQDVIRLAYKYYTLTVKKSHAKLWSIRCHDSSTRYPAESIVTPTSS